MRPAACRGSFAPSIRGLWRYRFTVRLLALALLALCVAACGGGGNAPVNSVANAPSNTPPESPLGFERVALEKLNERDPGYLWPRNDMRLSATEFWVIWRTDEFSKGQLIATRDRKLWYDLGQTATKLHYLPADLAKFGSEMSFCVEFEEGSERFRSKPREVRFGAGVRFSQRRLSCVVERAENQKFEIRTEAGDLQGLSSDDFRFALLPEGLVIYGKPYPEGPTGGRLELFIDGRTVPGQGCAGFWEIHDSRAGTWDRVLIEILVK